MTWLDDAGEPRDALSYETWRALITRILGAHDGPRDRFATTLARTSPRRHAATAFDEALALTARIMSGAADCTPLALKCDDFARRLESEDGAPPPPPTSVAACDYLPRTRPRTAWETPPMTAPDFDFTFRPDSYWDPADPITAIVANITGELRRNAVRAALEGDPVMGASIDGDHEALADHLSEERRTVQGAVHPWCMGGEYLPPYLPGEVEIARISMMSVTMDVIAVRARRHGGRIDYRAVDEYEGGSIRPLPPRSSRRPLTFRRLVRLIDAIQTECCAPGQSAIEEILDTNLCDRSKLERMEWFITVSSEFYPQLQAFYEQRAREWCERKRLEWMEHCEDCGATYDPFEEDHTCPESEARLAREEAERETGRRDAR